MSLLLRQARVLVHSALQVKEGEDVLILWDGTVSVALRDAFWYAIQEAGARPFLLIYEPLWRRPLKEYCFFTEASVGDKSLELPQPLLGTMSAVDAVVMVHSDMDMLLADELLEVLADGSRILFLPYLSDETAERLLPETGAEAEDVKQLVTRFGAILDAGGAVQVTTPQGTDLSMSLGQWPTNLHTGIARSGVLQVLPAGQVSRVPDEGSANGVLVIDRSIASSDYRKLVEPIRFQIENGNVVSIDGGLEARLVQDFLKSLNDPRVYHLTELGIGTNPRCRYAGTGAPTEDTHTMGIVSLALGCDSHIGGGLPAPVHIDMTMWQPTLHIGDRPVVDQGVLVRV